MSASWSSIGVVGCGLMGSGIAEVFARAGYPVLVHEVDARAAAAGRARIVASLSRAVRSGKLSQEAADSCLALLVVGTELEALVEVGLVVEAASENEQLKTSLFAQLDKVLTRDDAVLASNTSSIPIMKLGTATRRPEQVVGMHFFNPVPVLPLVELVPSLLSSPETVQRVQDLAERDLAKTVIRSQDRAGFIVNALLVPFLLSAVRMLERGSPRRATSTTGWCVAALTRWAPCNSPTSLAWTRRSRSLRACTQNSRNLCSPRPPCSCGWSTRGCWVARAGKGSTSTRVAPDSRCPARAAVAANRHFEPPVRTGALLSP